MERQLTVTQSGMDSRVDWRVPDFSESGTQKQTEAGKCPVSKNKELQKLPQMIAYNSQIS
ncbi:MAG TPA: hypothetical protein PK239_16680 [Chitinophagales bacterium]|nr:hypothetical protein [Chitinophagales bacterium]HRK28911.1 hypothetical protein [Chitinophagales bacterium]